MTQNPSLDLGAAMTSGAMMDDSGPWFSRDTRSG